MKVKSCFAFLGALLVLALGQVRTAEAGFQVTIIVDVLPETTIVDNGAGDLDPTVNKIQFLNEVVGAYTFSGHLSATNTSGTPTLSFVSSGTNLISGTGPATVRVVASANDFTAPTTPPDLVAISGSTAQFQAGTTNTNEADVSYNAYVNANNLLATTLPGGTLIGSDGATIAAPAGNANLSDSQVITSLGAPYAIHLELIAELNDTGTNNIDLDGSVEISPVPEPTTMAIWSLIGGIGAVAGWRRSRRKA